jgi:hypothetical protein
MLLTSPPMRAKTDKDLVNVGVPRAVHERASDWCKRKRFSQRDLLEGLLEWFLDQDDPVQRAMLGDVDQGMERFYIDVIRRRADEMEKALKQNPTRAVRHTPRRKMGDYVIVND